MRELSREEWTTKALAHERLVSPIVEAFLCRRSLGQKHPVHDFLFTYYVFSPAKLKQWVPSFEEILLDAKTFQVNDYWFEEIDNALRLNPKRLQGQALSIVGFIEQLCKAVAERPPRFGCFGLHEWAMVYGLSPEAIRHNGYALRLSPEELVRFVDSQNLCCTHYDAYRFFPPTAAKLNVLKPNLDTRLQNEQAGCLHANMDLYKWSTKLWPWIGSDFIAKAFMLALEGRELDMRASPYDLRAHGYEPICIETEEGRKEYQLLQQRYTQKSAKLRVELGDFCARLRAWQGQRPLSPLQCLPQTCSKT